MSGDQEVNLAVHRVGGVGNSSHFDLVTGRARRCQKVLWFGSLSRHLDMYVTIPYVATAKNPVAVPPKLLQDVNLISRC